MLTYMVVTDDKYELPLFVCDTERELRRYLGFSTHQTLANRFYRSNTGVVRSHKGVRYFRMDSDTGEIFKGKLPNYVYVQTQIEKGRRKIERKRQKARRADA